MTSARRGIMRHLLPARQPLSSTCPKIPCWKWFTWKTISDATSHFRFTTLVTLYSIPNTFPMTEISLNNRDKAIRVTFIWFTQVSFNTIDVSWTVKARTSLEVCAVSDIVLFRWFSTNTIWWAKMRLFRSNWRFVKLCIKLLAVIDYVCRYLYTGSLLWWSRSWITLFFFSHVLS